MMATGPNFWSRKWVGSGMIKLDCKVSPFKDSGSVSPWAALNVEKVTVEWFTDRRPSREWALPALSCQVWKCMVSLGPMLSRISQDFQVGDVRCQRRIRLVPPCSMNGEVESAVKAIALRWSV